VQQAAQAVLGRAPQLAVSGPANESYLLNGLGIPTCIIGPQGEQAHAANEYVVADSLFDAAAIYAHAALLLQATNAGEP
jgi:acetylornithine deacetylase/succinyl-diaminopimelate desuccinylase-like protein